MDQQNSGAARPSALQQRLQARREMFMKESSLEKSNGPAAAQPIYGSKISTPSAAPPQPPPNAPRSAKDSAATYGNKVRGNSEVGIYKRKQR